MPSVRWMLRFALISLIGLFAFVQPAAAQGSCDTSGLRTQERPDPEGTPTRVELGILAALAEQPGKAATRSFLASRVLDGEREGAERTLDVHVSRLRKKLGHGTFVETVWGIGYRLALGDDR